MDCHVLNAFFQGQYKQILLISDLRKYLHKEGKCLQQIRDNALSGVHYQKLLDDAEAWTFQHKMEDVCFCLVQKFLIMNTCLGIIPLKPWSLMKSIVSTFNMLFLKFKLFFTRSWQFATIMLNVMKSDTKHCFSGRRSPLTVCFGRDDVEKVGFKETK